MNTNLKNQEVRNKAEYKPEQATEKEERLSSSDSDAYIWNIENAGDELTTLTEPAE